jgi:hypothetical protein
MASKQTIRRKLVNYCAQRVSEIPGEAHRGILKRLHGRQFLEFIQEITVALDKETLDLRTAR